MDDSKKSVTAGARGEFTMTSDQRPAPRATSHLTRRPRTESRQAPRRPRRVAFACAAAVAGLLAALLAAAPAAAQTDVWTATLTPADFGSGLLGCNNASATSKCSTATVLSDDDFTYDSTDYSVTTLYLNATAFTLTVDTDITDATNALTVVVGSTSLAFADATQTARTRTWFNPGFSWTAGTAVSIRIPDTTPPELTSAAVAADGNSITVIFDESVDQTNLPAAGAFSVAADGAPVTVSGVSAGTAAQLVLALAAPGIRAGQVVTLGYTDPTDGDDTSAVQDTSGNDAVSFSDYSVTNNSIVVAVPSNWSLKPTGLNIGAKFRLLFLSSTKRDGSSSDIADYHAFIQTRAAAGHADIRTYSTGFRAVGCTADTDARDTTYTTYTSTDKGVPIYWLNGAKAADQYEDFYDGTWDDEVNDKNESGTNGPNTSLEANYPLTGCNDGGTEYFDRFNKSSALAKIEVMVGRPNSSGVSHGPLSSNTALDVSNTVTRPMYGLSAIFEVVPETTPPTLTSADVEETNGLTIYLEFSEDLQLSNPPLASAFTLTVDGSAVTGFSVAWPGALLPQNAIWLGPPTAIRQGQAVVVTYTDPTADNDTAAIQDTTGNDAADFTTGMNSVPAVINNSTVANAVLAGWSLTPTGLAVGDQFRLLFLSSTKRDATATDIATYNTFIQTRAAAGHTDIQAYSAGFRVVGCTAATDARDNTETTYTGTAKGVAIYWLDGAKAADEYEDFYDGTWDDEANDKNESGTDAHDTSQTANWPWTGCNHDGTELRQFAGTVSRGLGTNLADARVGRPDSSTVNHGPLSGLQNRAKTETRPLYGLSALFQVVGEDTTPPTLTSADVEITDALIINLVFSEDLQLSNPPALSAFTVTVDGSAATVSSVGVPGSVLPQNELWLQLSTAIRQRQAVVVTYTDATSGDDTAAIQDTAGNDAATFTTGMDGVPAVTNNSTVTKTVPADWSLIPTGLSTGDKFRLLFLSSTKRNSTATDIATYNTFIQTRAAAGHTDIQDYSADFRAVGCTADTDARDNTKTTYTTTDKGVPIYWLNGAKAADQYEDFYDGSWDDEANDKNESGTDAHDTSQNVNWPWTGCDHDGTEAVTSGDSFALGTNLVDARVGRPNSSASGHGPLNGQTNRSNFQNSPLYGLSEVFQVAAAVVVPNNPPTVATAIPDQSATAGTAFSYAFPANTFSDADTGDTLSYTATKADGTALPTWLAFTAGTRTFSGTPQAADAGTVSVKVTASDGNGGSVSDTFDITVAADTTPPTLTSVEVLAFGNILQWRFSENLNVQPGNLPPFSAFTVTADGRALTTNTVVRIPGVVDGFLLQLSSPFILQGQTVVVTYTDPTAGDDANAIQDTAGNDAATFTTGMNGVPAVTNNSTVTNTPATGAPTITGTAQVGQTLTAGTTAIMDADGLTSVSYTYQWIRTATGVDTNISGATASTYTLVAADLGTTIKVRVSFTDDASNAETLTSAATAAVSANNPPTSSNKNLALNEDTELTFFASDFTFTDADGNSLSSVKILSLPATDKGTLTFSGMALTSGDLPQTVPAAQFNSLKYVPPANENGGEIPFTSFTFRVNDGTDDSAATYTLSLFVYRVNDAATGQPGITGTAQVGQTLAATAGTIADVDGLPDPFLTDTNTSFQWVRVTSGTDADISGARDSTYTLVADDEGKKIKVKVSFLDTEATTNQTEGPLTSAATATVSASTNTPATGAPTITGTAQVGQTLTAGTTAIMDADGLTSVSYTYQWIRTAAGVDTNISSATASTYTLVAADLGTTVKVRVSFTDDASNAETLTSAATATVSAAPNTPATGAPTITGTAQVGQTLTAGTTAIMDDDGLTTPGYTYQWIRTAAGVDTNISGATASTYTLVAADLGTTVKVRVSFTDDASNAETLTSTATAAVAAAANTPATGAPTITGTAQVGQTLTADTTAIVDADGLTNVSYTYQWIRVDGGTETNIASATASTYTLVAADQGTTIKVTVSFTDDASNAETLTSAATAAVSAAPNTPATGAPTITGTAQVGQTLTAGTTAIMDDDGLTSVSYTYQWIRVATDNTETNIASATASTYTLVAADQGTTIKVTVSFTDDASNAETLTSAATAAVSAAPNTPATGAPTITGTAQVGQTLTAGTTAIMDANGLTSVSYTYQWIRVATDNTETNIASATASTYTLVAADQGTTIKVKVSFTDDASNAETLTSAATAAVAAAVPNNPPAFSADTAARSVAENTAAGQNVGAALTATDADSDTLTYTLEGTDAASFDIVSGSGQIRTRTGVTYNHEAKSTHTVVVKADDGNGGTDTIAVTITVTDVDEPPGQPAAPSVSATAGSTTSLDVTWTAPTNTGPAIASYDLQYRAGTSGNFTNGPQNVTGTSAAIGSLAADTSYEVQVRATNAEGDGDWSVAGTGRTTATSAPGAPTGLTATASGTTQINLSWSAPASTGGSAITGYKIEVSPNGTSGWTDQVANTNSTATTYAHTGLASGDTRHYRVSAINANGAGTASNVDSATTVQVPAAVSNVVAVPVPRTPDSLQVSWSAPDNAGKPALTGYDVRYREEDVNWTTVRQDATSTSVIIAGLGSSNFYDVQVRALNADGSGPWSSTAEAVTSPRAERVYANHPLIPADLGPGDAFRLLFITRGTTAATDTGIHTYHNHASSDAIHIVETGNLVSEWGTISLLQTPLVSTPGADARLHTDTTWTETDRGMPIYWLNGARVADDYADFYDGVWADEANPTNGLGNPHSLAGTAPWTGTDHDGTELFNGTASRAIGQASVSVGGLGSTITGAGPLNGGVIFANTQERPIYGLWHVLVVDENLRLVTNFQQLSRDASGIDARAAVRAQLFTTGPNSTGYGISSIEVVTGADTNIFLGTVALYTTDTDGNPDLADGLHATLSLERVINNYLWRLVAPEGTVLKPTTTYAMVFLGDAGTYPEPWTIDSDGEDVPAEGWSLADALLYWSGTSWVENPNGRSLSMEIVGPRLETEGPALVSATVGAAGNAVTLVFDEDVVLPSDSAEALTFLASLASAFAVTADGAGVAVSGLTAASGDSDQLTIVLSGVILQGQAVTLTYTDPTAGDDAVALQDVLGNETPTFTTGLHGVPAVINNSTITVLTTTVPGAPTGLTAIASGTTQINLSWSAPASSGGSAITGYKIEVSANGTSGWTDQVANTNSTATTYAHTGLGAGDTRHYRVSAINTNGAGTASNVDSATTGTTVPGAPTGLTATASGTTQINLSWSAPASSGGSAITGYKIEVSSDGGSSWSDLVANTSNTTTTYAHTGLAAGDTRHYRVSAINANGTGVPSNVDSATTGTTVPGAPTGLTATASGTTQIDLSWSAPVSTGGSAITGYKIEVSSDGGSSWSDQVANTSNTTTTYAHTGLGGGDTRHYRVSAINTNGAGTASNVDSATTGTTVPGAPTGLSATASGTTAINLSWIAPGSTGGSAITGYKIEVSLNGTSGWTDQVANTSNTTTTYAHTGLAAGATRHYRVSAINTNGTGTASNVDSATTGQTTVTFGASSYTAAEGGATATVAVQLSAAASATVTIPLTKTHRGGATAADYSGVPSNVTFTAGQTRRTFTVTATDDADKDGGESVQLGFGTLPGGYAPGARRTATVTLVDDDANLIVNFGTERHTVVKVLESDTVRHRFTLSLSTRSWGPPNGNPQQRVTIPLVVTHVGGAKAEEDYEGIPKSVTFEVGQSVTDFFMMAIPDGKREPGEGLRLDFGPLPPGVRKGTWGPHETIEFVDQVLPGYTVLFGAEAYTATEGGAPARVSIHLSEPVEIEPLVVRLVVTHVGATAADYTGIPKSVRFAVGEQTQTITVKATDDTDDDDGESVTLSFVNDPNGRVRVRTGPASATVALADNDGLRRVTVSFGAVTYTATEGGADATVRVELDAAPGRSVTVPLTKAHLGNATAADYSGIPMNVTFAANQTSRTFAVMATADQIADGGESVSIGFGTLPEGVFAGSPAATTVTLADGSEQRLVVNFGSSRGHTVQVREGARRLRLNVLLDSSPRRPVTIPLVVTHVGGATEADYAAIPESVTFAAGQTSAHYYVRALPDEEEETGEGLRLDFGPLPPGVRKGTWGPYETIAFVDAGQTANLSVAGPVLTLDYPWALDGGSTPSPRDFVVSAEAPGGAKDMVPVAAVSLQGSDVFLQLDRPVAPDETVTLTYLTAAMHPIRAAAGRPAAPLTDEPVLNVTGASGPLAEAGLAAGTALPAPIATMLEAAQEGAGTERLDLSSRNLTELSALAGLSGLRELDLRHNAITDLSPLAGLTGLEVLNLSGNQIEELWPLAGLTALQRLDLSDNRIEDIATLAELTGLEVLDLSGNRIEELWPLAGLTALQRLDLSDNRIEELWPLAGLSGLQVLLLDRNRVADVSALSPLAELENLGLSGNQIADIGLLTELGRLHRLDLSGNAVADVSALGDVSGLVWLQLPGNPVSDVTPLGRLEKLLWLWLDSRTAAGMEALAPPAGRGEAQLWIELTPAQ